MADPIIEAVHADPIVQAVLAAPDDRRGGTVTTQAGNTVASPTTTEEQDRATAGQRDTSLVWESTQRQIAIGFAYASIMVSAYLIIAPNVPPELRLVAFTFLSTMAATINQNYFTRTNHTKVPGVKYEGR